jgi:hypothetical protein
MDPVEILCGLRSPKIVWDLNSFEKPHVSRYPGITTRQLSMVVRPYPGGWAMPMKRQYLWHPSATLFAKPFLLCYPIQRMFFIPD